MTVWDDLSAELDSWLGDAGIEIHFPEYRLPKEVHLADALFATTAGLINPWFVWRNRIPSTSSGNFINREHHFQFLGFLPIEDGSSSGIIQNQTEAVLLQIDKHVRAGGTVEWQGSPDAEISEVIWPPIGNVLTHRVQIDLPAATIRPQTVLEP